MKNDIQLIRFWSYSVIFTANGVRKRKKWLSEMNCMVIRKEMMVAIAGYVDGGIEIHKIVMKQLFVYATKGISKWSLLSHVLTEEQ